MDFKALENYLESLYTEKGVGMNDLIVMREHQVVFRKFSGYKHPEKKIPMQGDEWYYIYSCTKMTTCVSVMQLIEQGRLSLDTKLSDVIPEFSKLYLVNGEEAKRPVTIFHLMAMRAGFNYDFAEVKDRVDIQTASTLDMVKAMAGKKLLFHPGDNYEYSLCHDILAAVVEVVTGMSFGEYVEENIFAPLGMKNVKFTYEDNEKEKFASQFRYEGDGKFVDIPLGNAFRFGPKYESGGAGLIASTEEYAKLPDALANGGVGATGNRILKAESIEKFKLDSMYTGVREGYMHEKGYSYGLGFRTKVSKDFGGRSPIGEFGWDGALGCYYFVDTENHLSCFFATHMASEHMFLYREVHPKIRDLIYEGLGI